MLRPGPADVDGSQAYSYRSRDVDALVQVRGSHSNQAAPGAQMCAGDQRRRRTDSIHTARRSSPCTVTPAAYSASDGIRSYPAKEQLWPRIPDMSLLSEFVAVFRILLRAVGPMAKMRPMAASHNGFTPVFFFDDLGEVAALARTVTISSSFSIRATLRDVMCVPSPDPICPNSGHQCQHTESGELPAGCQEQKRPAHKRDRAGQR